VTTKSWRRKQRRKRVKLDPSAAETPGAAIAFVQAVAESLRLTVRVDYRSRIKLAGGFNRCATCPTRSFVVQESMVNPDQAEVLGSVWIRPTGTALESIERALRLAHKRAGGPPVQPHVSLMGGIELTPDTASKLQKLASRLQSFEIRLGKIEWRDEYYRSLFISVEPSDELLSARGAAHEAFGRLPSGPFEPHVSLIYGDFDETFKKELAEELGSRLDARFMATAVDLVNACEKVEIGQWKTLYQAALRSARVESETHDIGSSR
jgi:2'-5' RNA ligase